jgi:hypothetical protein
MEQISARSEIGIVDWWWPLVLEAVELRHIIITIIPIWGVYVLV